MSEGADWLMPYDKGEWYQVPAAFARTLPSREAHVLACLVAAYRMAVREGDHRRGWVRLSNRRLQAMLPFRRDRIQRALRKLREAGIVRTERRGAPARRWLRIEREAFQAALGQDDPVVSRPIHLDVSRSIQLDVSRPIHLIYRRTSIEQPAPRPAGRRVRVDSITVDAFRGFADDLHSMVSSVRSVPSSSKPASWAQSFRTLHKRGVAVERIAEVLRWYRETLRLHGDLIRAGRTFIPVAYSGPRWLDKWESLEAAMERDRGAGGSRAPDVKVRMVERGGGGRKKRGPGSRYGDDW